MLCIILSYTYLYYISGDNSQLQLRYIWCSTHILWHIHKILRARD